MSDNDIRALAPWDPATAADWWEDLRTTTEQAFEHTAEVMQRTIGVSPRFDELALMVMDGATEYLMLESAVRYGGWQWTNAATDHVVTQPIPSAYEVHYSFLTSPDRAWRIEVMRLEAGVSPLHSTFINRTTVLTVHHSFKVDDPVLYDETFEAMRDGKWQCAQRCDSTYGRFSYWRPPMDSLEEAGSVFVKPRVNLRDQQVQS